MKVQRRIGARITEGLSKEERQHLEERIRKAYPQAFRVKVVGTSANPIVELWQSDGKGGEYARVGSVVTLLGDDA